MNNPIKASRATIALGDIPLEVFMLPSGEYRLSEVQVTESVDKTSGYVRDFLKGKAPEAASWKDYTVKKIGIEKDHVGRGASRINAIPIELAVAFWTKEAVAGNSKAARLLGACAIESIERRADQAFNVQRTESERQALMKVRVEGKGVRRELTDAIADYIKRHPELSDNRRKFMFINVSQQVDKKVFGRVAHQLASDLGVAAEKLRDALTAAELRLVTELENSAMRRIDLHDVDPVQAVKEAADALLIPVQERKLQKGE